MNTVENNHCRMTYSQKLVREEIDNEIINHIRWLSEVPPCPICKTFMQRGKAIQPNTTDNALYICAQPLINSNTLKIIDCWKCPRCGHSDDGK